MIAQWENECISQAVGRIQLPATAEYFNEFFPDWSYSANLSWASLTEKGSISPQWHHATCGHRGRRPRSNHGQVMGEIKYKRQFYGKTIIVRIPKTWEVSCHIGIKPASKWSVWACGENSCLVSMYTYIPFAHSRHVNDNVGVFRSIPLRMKAVGRLLCLS